MNRTGLALLLAVFGAASAGAAARPADPERRYGACPGSEVLAKAANVSWKPLEPTVGKHRDLRARLNLDFPDGSDRILLHSFGSYHSIVEFSIVGVRRRDGIWHFDEAGLESGGMLTTGPRRLPHRRYDLSAQDSRRVDLLIADPCLRAAPTFLRDPNIVAGGALQTLEIRTRRRSVILSWHGLRPLQAETLIGLVARD